MVDEWVGWMAVHLDMTLTAQMVVMMVLKMDKMMVDKSEPKLVDT